MTNKHSKLLFLQPSQEPTNENFDALWRHSFSTSSYLDWESFIFEGFNKFSEGFNLQFKLNMQDNLFGLFDLLFIVWNSC